MNPQMIDQFECYSPDKLENYSSYLQGGHSLTEEIEASSFWVRSRNRLISQLFKRYVFSKYTNIHFYDAGCGTGEVLKALQGFDRVKFYGSELFLDGLRIARKKIPHVHLFQIDLTELNFEERFECIGSFDVLEHIENDQKVLHSFYRSLKPGGTLLLSVPQYQWMWSSLDDLVCHQRRYSYPLLKERLEKAGFQIKFKTSFVFLLFPLMVVNRLKEKLFSNTELDETAALDQKVQFPLWMDRLFDLVMKIDEAFIRLGISLPWGGSLFVVCEKKCE
ncbi:MAG: hypothetical protein CL678_02995 [Bdellovibrionaceae bacterium]|nr:hypothetical protein [Pseudobdellovibrionaceae bacterium]|tara:strand:- start:2434 stop:3264 length:831 start_codon:yes stop_codon:yes gene_type:complete